MARSQSIQDRVFALQHCCNGHDVCALHGMGQQAHSFDQDQLSLLRGHVGKAEHSAEVFHKREGGYQLVLNAHRIDEIGHAIFSHLLHAESPWCASGVGKSMAYTSSSNNPINIWTPLISGVRQIGAAS